MKPCVTELHNRANGTEGLVRVSSLCFKICRSVNKPLSNYASVPANNNLCRGFVRENIACVAALKGGEKGARRRKKRMGTGERKGKQIVRGN